MKERYMSKVAIFLFLARENNGIQEVLLQLRQNTGYMDNKYDFSVSGHVEKGEDFADAVIREAKEEIGIDILKKDLDFTFLLHEYNDDYVHVFFKTKCFKGEPMICEPTKCADLHWFRINELPENIIPRVKDVLECIKNDIKYDDGNFTFLKENIPKLVLSNSN